MALLIWAPVGVVANNGGRCALFMLWLAARRSLASVAVRQVGGGRWWRSVVVGGRRKSRATSGRVFARAATGASNWNYENDDDDDDDIRVHCARLGYPQAPGNTSDSCSSPHVTPTTSLPFGVRIQFRLHCNSAHGGIRKEEPLAPPPPRLTQASLAGADNTIGFWRPTSGKLNGVSLEV